MSDPSFELPVLQSLPRPPVTACLPCVRQPPGDVRPLPMSVEECRARGWDEVDVVFVTGDAYVDHPSFAMAILGRVLEAAGFRVAILSQPDWRSCDDWRRFGRPRLFFGDQRRQHGLDDQPLHGEQERSATTTPTRPAAGSACGRIGRRWPTASGPARRTPACR